MRSTATHVAWSVCVSVCCRVTSVSHAKTTESIEMSFRCKAQGTTASVLAGARISHQKRHFWEMAMLGYTPTCVMRAHTWYIIVQTDLNRHLKSAHAYRRNNLLLHYKLSSADHHTMITLPPLSTGSIVTVHGNIIILTGL